MMITTKRCDECWFYWDGAGFIKRCHEPDARMIIKATDTDCPWFTEHAQSNSEKVHEFTDDDYDEYEGESDEWN